MSAVQRQQAEQQFAEELEQLAKTDESPTAGELEPLSVGCIYLFAGWKVVERI